MDWHVFKKKMCFPGVKLRRHFVDTRHRAHTDSYQMFLKFQHEFTWGLTLIWDHFGWSGGPWDGLPLVHKFMIWDHFGWSGGPWDGLPLVHKFMIRKERNAHDKGTPANYRICANKARLRYFYDKFQPMEKQKGFNPLFEFHHYWFWPTFFPFEVCTLEKNLFLFFHTWEKILSK